MRLFFAFFVSVNYGSKHILGTLLFPVFLKSTTLINRVVNFEGVSLFLLIVIGGVLAGIGFGLVKRSTYSLGGFFDEEGNLKSDENVVIYDMGAGTLDLSLISFKQTGSGIITASIVNKIGIPLAGNYLRYLMYKTLKDKKKLKSDKEFKDNTIHELVEGIKREYKEPDKPIVDLRPSWFTAEQDKLEIKTKIPTIVSSKKVSKTSLLVVAKQ